jgi:hypothetical protein
MSAELDQHFHFRVRAAYEKYASVRAGRVSGMQEDKGPPMEAAKLLYHLHEHIPAAHKENWRTIAARFPDFSLIRDVADADKHHDLRDQSRAIASLSQIEERIVVTFYRDVQGEYRHVEKRVFLKLTGGAERDVFDLLASVMNFWIGELTKWGYVTNLKLYSTTPRSQPIPRSEADGRMGLQHMQGVSMTQVFMIQRYNEATGQIEPEDITGWNVEWTARKVNFAMDVTFTNEATGETVRRSVPIPDEDYLRVQSFPPDVRDELLFALPCMKEAIRAIQVEIRQLDRSSEIKAPTP